MKTLKLTKFRICYPKFIEIFRTAFVSVALVGRVFATVGIDATDPISVSAFKCLYRNGYRFFIGRVWKSYGMYDYTGMENIKNARAGAFLIYVEI